jgi:cytoskeletal protein RodZ
MLVMRIILLLVILGGLTLLLAQNWSPALPLVFLGVKTQALPLALWILLSVGAGACTSIFITGLFKLSNYFARYQPQYRRNTVEGSRTQSSGSKNQSNKATSASYSQPDTNSVPKDTTDDDWGSNSTDDDDWDFADKTENFSSQKDVKDSTTYEVNTEPKSGYRAGSVYSYNYREPRNSGVGKTESVYDADYRVITPPYQPPSQEKDTTGEEDDDWGFEDDDDKEGNRE